MAQLLGYWATEKPLQLNLDRLSRQSIVLILKRFFQPLKILLDGRVNTDFSLQLTSACKEA